MSTPAAGANASPATSLTAGMTAGLTTDHNPT